MAVGETVGIGAEEGRRAAVAGNGMFGVLRRRDFRLLFVGESISLLGDQFSLIALPWLVLRLTSDALAVGTVMALAGIPRALFILVGGALVKASLTGVFVGAGLLVLLVTVRVALVPAVRAMGLEEAPAGGAAGS